MSRFTRLATLAAIAFAAAPVAGAEAHSAISGTVINCMNGAPIANAPVTVDGSGRTGYADANGNFNFYNLPNGVYRLRASAVHRTYGNMYSNLPYYSFTNISWRTQVIVRPANFALCAPHLR